MVAALLIICDFTIGLDPTLFRNRGGHRKHSGVWHTTRRDGRIQLVTSQNHYVFNLAWIKALPLASER